MTNNATDETNNPIFAELTRELADPSESDLRVSPPPEFAELLVNEALSGRHRDNEDGVTPLSPVPDEPTEGTDQDSDDGSGRHAQPGSGQ
ncbi:hypothetical protein FHR84_004140 [Actinopolyspora biskrensis]|uniref:Uncharacterized protein n=1 Tax=Actinopolyspora biskrensis TaxID=1470178 RepID=A0A852Z439_9ACTN|nr:hypothetical protein [Actinopolyspora biskrensis]NYH80772.1 hypothetical protein [Actinopolyspora biskrensis]